MRSRANNLREGFTSCRFARYVEAKTYNSIGQNEATVALTLSKELLKAVYQYASLLGELKAFQKQTQQ